MEEDRPDHIAGPFVRKQQPGEEEPPIAAALAIQRDIVDAATLSVLSAAPGTPIGFIESFSLTHIIQM